VLLGGHSVSGQSGQSSDRAWTGSGFHLRATAATVSAGTRATHNTSSQGRGTSCWSRASQWRRRCRWPGGSWVPHRSVCDVMQRWCQLAVVVRARTERRNRNELNWHGLVFDELTKFGRAGPAHWSLVDAYVRIVT